MGYNIKTKHCFLLVWESRTLISSPSDGTYNWVGYIAGIGVHNYLPWWRTWGWWWRTLLFTISISYVLSDHSDGHLLVPLLDRLLPSCGRRRG